MYAHYCFKHHLIIWHHELLVIFICKCCHFFKFSILSCSLLLFLFFCARLVFLRMVTFCVCVCVKVFPGLFGEVLQSLTVQWRKMLLPFTTVYCSAYQKIYYIKPPEVTLNKMSFLSCLSAIIVPNAMPIHKFPVQYLAAGYCPPLSNSQSFVGGKRF